MSRQELTNGRQSVRKVDRVLHFRDKKRLAKSNGKKGVTKCLTLLMMHCGIFWDNFFEALPMMMPECLRRGNLRFLPIHK